MPNSKAKFYLRSYVDQNADGYAFTGSFIETSNAVDRRADTYAYTDDTGAGDGIEEEIVAEMGTEREIDMIFLRSNFRTFTVQAWDENVTGTGGEGWTDLVSYAANTKEFLAISFDQVSTSRIRIVCTNTIGADDVKKLYALEITTSEGELSLEKIQQMRAWERETWKNIYGGSVQVVQYPNRGKCEIKLAWENMGAADYAVYKSLKALFLIDALLVYLYFTDDFDLLGEEALYLVNDIADLEASPASDTPSAGVNGEMRLQEC